MDELLKNLPALGVGGILAAFIFYHFQKATKEHAERITLLSKENSERLADIIKDQREDKNTLIEVVSDVKESVASNTEVNRTLVTSVNGLSQSITRLTSPNT